MKRAWEIRRQHRDNVFSACLHMAWEEAKNNSKKDAILLELERTAADKQRRNPEAEYDAVVNEWKKYGKFRLYLSIVCWEGRKRTVLDYGYFDVNEDHYCGKKSCDLAYNQNLRNLGQEPW